MNRACNSLFWTFSRDVVEFLSDSPTFNLHFPANVCIHAMCVGVCVPSLKYTVRRPLSGQQFFLLVVLDNPVITVLQNAHRCSK